ncbi:hypothetical protein PVT71_15830 [Salipiger sp. H15]|uniref:Uncharacterized protein n=1 Tax=Alloyangia sp. H15 TaxID=3029062 RepID=A0AAU8ANT0_9RHOB
MRVRSSHQFAATTSNTATGVATLSWSSPLPITGSPASHVPAKEGSASTLPPTKPRPM